MRNYTEITVYTTHEGGDLVSDILWEYTEDGVAINDFEDVVELSKSGRSWDYVDDKVLLADKTVIVKAYILNENAPVVIPQIEQRLDQLKRFSPFNLGTLETSKRVVDGDLWREQWKEHFKPIPINNVVIVPEWIDYTAKNGEIKVLLDSNMAFGTGEHETTSMCVKYLQKYVDSGDTVLDVGCGSGILGITASLIGAKQVIMTDIDDCAVTATEHNMKLNGVKNATVMNKNLLDDTTVKGDVIVVNIMAEVLIYFAPYIGNNLKGKGIIILSGILKDRLDKVAEAYKAQGFSFVESEIKGEWSCLVMQRA